ncbi:MAG: hypothetical protein LAP85_13890 [Acidobacteriia bacterium]|nr:hypothetical protein [Terriglobia bacterium]
MDDRASRGSLVWIISTEQWPRAILRAELIEHGFDAVGYLTLDEALVELPRRLSRKPQIIILDLSGQEITRARLFALVREAIPIVILGGAVEVGDPLIGEFSWAGILKRPFMIREIIALVDQLVRRTSHA